jgi:hypothetical protein
VSVFDWVAGAVIFVGSVISVRLYYTRLDSRRGSRVSQLLSAPGGSAVRIWVLTATLGAMLIARGSAAWPFFAGAWFGIVAWEVTVQATAWIRRVRHRRAAQCSFLSCRVDCASLRDRTRSS